MILPRYNLFGQNQLIFDYNLIIADKKKCVGTLPDNVRTSILPESTIDLTRALSCAAHARSRDVRERELSVHHPPDLAETAVVMANQPNLATVEAFLQLMGRFGDSTGAPVTGLTVTRTVDSDAIGGKDILVLGGTQLAQLGSLFGSTPVRYENGRLRVAERGAVDRVFEGQSPFDRAPDQAELLYGTDNFAGIVSFQSPFQRAGTVIALLANDPVGCR